MSAGSWGAGRYGAGPWGGATTGAPTLLSALAVAENVVQLTFSQSVYFSGLLDPYDASNRKLYAFTPNPIAIGYDGTPSRPVNPASVALGGAPGFFLGQILLVTLDRVMTPFPSQYSVAVTGLASADKLALLATPATASFQGILRNLVPPSLDAPTVPATRDLANPQTLLGAIAGKVPSPLTAANLGTFVVDTTGDYAYDQGLEGYKKRILRILVTVPGGFLHLGQNYGAGVGQLSKKLASTANRARLASRVQSQIALDPMTAAVSVTVQRVQAGLYRLVIVARTKSGATVKYNSPLGTQVGARAGAG